MKKEAPIVFIHYGDTPYLKYTLDIAKKTNPDKEVVLLGDKKNEKYEKIGIKHFYFDDYNKGEEIEIFDRVFQFIAGTSHKKKAWVNFVFRRWFYIYNFAKQNNIQSFWTFDSDNLILSNLSKHEERFSKIDCTSQCNGSCMNGYIKNLHVVKAYLDKINELFQRSEYLKKQEREFEQHPNWAFTEMRAFETFKEENRPKVYRLNSILDNETFDECICQEHGMEMEYNLRFNRMMKKLYFKDNKIYEKSIETGKLAKVNTLNMSWVTTSFIEKVYYYKMHGKFPPFYVSLLGKISRIPRFIKTKITKKTK